MPTDYDLDQISPVGSVVDTDKLYIVTAAGFDGRATAAQLRATTASKISDFTTSVDARITAQKDAANGLCSLDGSSKVPMNNLTSSGASSVVVRDANQNVTANAYINNLNSVVASATQIGLTVGSAPVHVVSGSGGQTFKLPDASTLAKGTIFSFNNNQSSGAISVNNFSSTLVASIPSGGYSTVVLLDNSIAAGVWERHEQAPSNVSWSTNTLSYTGAISGATWNGVAIGISYGGTGAATQQGAINALTGNQIGNAGKFLRSDGSNASLSAIQAADVPTLNQSTTGTASNVTGVVGIANGGTGQSTQAAALTAIAGPQSGQSGKVLRSDGTNTTLSAIQASDIPALNQNTTGTAANVTGTVGIANGGTGATTRQAAMDALAGATTSGQYLRGNGTNVALSAIQAADVPTLNQNTTGTAANVTGTVAVGNGGTGATTLTGLVKGNGTAAMTVATPGTDYVTPSGNITGTAGNVTGTVAIGNGGTGATSASTARTALGAAASGTNTDITSVALTSGTVSGAPSATTDIVNKQYADSIGSSVNFHNACDYATIAALSPAATYAQPGGATVGVNATLTGQANTALQIDGATVSVGQRVLVKNQSSTFQNGIYNVTRQGDGSTLPYILTRAADYDNTTDVQAGDLTVILSGSLANSAWVQQTSGTITFGTSAITFAQFSSAAAGVSSFATTLNGLTTTSSTGAVSLGGTLGVAGGGTGASNASDALTNLGSGGFRYVEAVLTTAVAGTVTNNVFTASSAGVVSPDSYSISVGDIILFTSQGGTSNVQNGPWVAQTVGTASVAAVFIRPSWFTGTVKPTTAITRFGSTRYHNAYNITATTTGDIVVGTSSIYVNQITQRSSTNAGLAGNTYSGKQILWAGTTGGNIPLSFQMGAIATTPIAHSVEWDGTTMYLTNLSSLRDNVLTQNSFGTY
jgi:hypothetical protein